VKDEEAHINEGMIYFTRLLIFHTRAGVVAATYKKNEKKIKIKIKAMQAFHLDN